MLKLIELGSEDFGEPAIKIVDDWSGRGLTKAAADSRVSEFVRNLNPESGQYADCSQSISKTDHNRAVYVNWE